MESTDVTSHETQLQRSSFNVATTVLLFPTFSDPEEVHP
jgi:hypothetical protein